MGSTVENYCIFISHILINFNSYPRMSKIQFYLLLSTPTQVQGWAFRISQGTIFVKSTKPWGSVGCPPSHITGVHCQAPMFLLSTPFMLCLEPWRKLLVRFWMSGWGRVIQYNPWLFLQDLPTPSHATRELSPGHTLAPPSCPRESHCSPVNPFLFLHISPCGLLLLSSSSSLFSGSSFWKKQHVNPDK